jgi:ribonuclease BN (tRNA processing enzyme)
MRVKKLSLWELNNYTYKFPTNLTSVLNTRAGVKSGHYNYLYLSRESSVERNIASPGVTAVLRNEYSSVKSETQKSDAIDIKKKEKKQTSFLMNLRKRLTGKTSTNSNSNIKIVDSNISSNPVPERVFNGKNINIHGIESKRNFKELKILSPSQKYSKSQKENCNSSKSSTKTPNTPKNISTVNNTP